MAAAAASTAGKRIVFTGGSGKAGPYCIDYLLNRGHKVLNLDLTPLKDPRVHTLKTDLTNSGQVFNALSSNFSMSNFEDPHVPKTPDAVIHFAAYSRNMIAPDNECFAANTISTYNVIEAACKLGIKKIVIASSETTYGVCFTQGDSDYHTFPLEEDYDCDPADSYACSKLCGERAARSFARRFGVDIYALRIGNVIEPHEYARDFPGYVKSPEVRKRNAWSYIDARDLGQICDLCVGYNGGGFQVFNATNDENTTALSTEELLAKYAKGTKDRKRELGEVEAPLSNRKIREVLGFKENWNWKKILEEEKVAWK